MKKFILLLLFIPFSYSCSLKPKVVSQGIKNLEIKQNTLIVNQSNKNDATTLLGEALIKDYINKNLWIYTEVEEETNFFGKKKLIKNNFLLLLFNNKGILIDKENYNLKDLKELKFSEELTETYAINKSIVSRFIYGMRKRLESRDLETKTK